jgi:hypothetical protein
MSAEELGRAIREAMEADRENAFQFEKALTFANSTPPAISADHIGDATNMVAPVEAVAWLEKVAEAKGWIENAECSRGCSSWRPDVHHRTRCDCGREDALQALAVSEPPPSAHPVPTPLLEIVRPPDANAMPIAVGEWTPEKVEPGKRFEIGSGRVKLELVSGTQTPAPIKPSADTGELKSAAPAEQGRGQFVEETVVSDAMSAFRGARTHGYPEQDAMRHALNSVLAALQAAPAVELKPNTGELRERLALEIEGCLGLADAILDLIQSERAG